MARTSSASGTAIIVAQRLACAAVLAHSHARTCRDSAEVEISSGYDHPLNPGLLAFTISGTPTAIENAKLQIFYAVVRAGVVMPLAIAHAHRVVCRVVRGTRLV
jgi:hypothetical protein